MQTRFKLIYIQALATIQGRFGAIWMQTDIPMLVCFSTNLDNKETMYLFIFERSKETLDRKFQFCLTF